ncbi:MAG TPA: metal ABC transporter permease [bacterium]|nr:metal ABC transporter permease [bacterium]
MMEFMAVPFVAAVILTGIHVYLGMHILRRGVIFVDLAIAQLAAFGTIIALVAGFSAHGPAGYFIPLFFTFLGAVIFTAADYFRKQLNQEALIGIVYVAATAAAVIALVGAPAEADQIKHMLVGNILFVSGFEVLKMALIYLALGVFYFIFRKKFELLTEKTELPGEGVKKSMVWNFLFYATFGIVVTSSVKVAGVLLVFSYLIIPAVCASLLIKPASGRLILGWVFGIGASVAGFAASALLDFPTGAAIVCALSGLFVLVVMYKAAGKLTVTGKDGRN